jgi:hypothetical protein
MVDPGCGPCNGSPLPAPRSPPYSVLPRQQERKEICRSERESHSIANLTEQLGRGHFISVEITLRREIMISNGSNEFSGVFCR